MPHTIHEAGLSDDAIHAVESLVNLLRANGNEMSPRRRSVVQGSARVVG